MSNNMKRICWLGNLLLACVFVAMLFLPLGDSWLKIDKTVLNEKRNLATQPDMNLSWQTLRNFPGQFDNFYRDHFGFRGQLIRWLSVLRTKGIGVSCQDDVVIGKNEWLYFAPPMLVHGIRRTQPLGSLELAQWRNLFEEANRWCRGHGIHFLLTIAPEKSTIYPEFLPAHLQPVGDTSRMDQLFRYMRENTDVPLLDLRPALLTAKMREPVYHCTDTHWTPAGSHVVYTELTNKLREWFPSLDPLPRGAFTEKKVTAKGGDLAGMLGVPDWFPETTLLLKRNGGSRYKERPYGEAEVKDFRMPVLLTNKKGIPLKVVLIRDSFGNRIKPFFGETMATTILMYPMRFDTAILEKEKPDIVIWEMAERNLSAPRIAKHPIAVQDYAAAMPPPVRREPYKDVVQAWRRNEIGKAWKCGAGLRQMPGGVNIPKAKAGPALSWQGEIPSANLSAVRITVNRPDAPDHMRLFFARKGDMQLAGRPFHNERSVPFRRLDPNNPKEWTAVLTESNYWESTACKLMVGVGVAETKGGVTVTAIEFLH